MLGLKLSLLVLMSLTCATLAFDDMTKMIRVFCDAPAEAYDKAVKCLDNLSETFNKGQEICMEEVAGTKDHPKFKEALCDDTKDIANGMRECVHKYATSLGYELTAEDAVKGLETVTCIRRVIS